MIYGPYYPSSITGWLGSGPYTASVVGEGVTPELIATSFNAQVPANETPTEIRFVILKHADCGPHQIGNDSVKELVPSAEELSPQQGDWANTDRADTYKLDNTQIGTPFTADDVNESAFGLKLVGYAVDGGLFSVSSIALYIET